ncbi:hypothetical protein D9758_002341 [Tetrapyrgos nigripes]|uniref:Uncharacterized protein n=1 Tax=Tetrapyrgos nigripes TaxID=182062 RepID=A0A8H5GNM4_9AGAR|nr:hypothetical protein D9758_002341 [Tetrapyrgos nigripes]
MADSDSTVPTTEIFDSLPYYDNDLDEDPTLREKVERELARHRKNPTTLHPRVPEAYQLFTKNPLLQAELERVESHQPFPPIDTIRFQLPSPTSAPGTDEEWQASLKNARAQLEHQKIRQTNVSLLQTYGPNAWRIHNYVLEAQAKQIEKALEDLKQLTVEVNRERKNQQERLGKQLNTLETRWTELISSVLQIEMANVALDGEIDKLNKKEAEMAEMNWILYFSPEPSILGQKRTKTSVLADAYGKLEQRTNIHFRTPSSLVSNLKPSNAESLAVSVPDASTSTPNPTPSPTIPSPGALDSKPSPTHSNNDGAPSNTPAASRPVLVQLGSGNPAAPVPQPKRFAHSNINKKFLEKNSSAPTAASSSTSISSKPGATITRPPTQSSSSHPRLITTKLTAAPQSSSSPGPGWSRPSSVTPPVSAPVLNGTPTPAPATNNASTTSVPQLPHAGKVIQPQPRSVAQLSTLKDSAVPSGGVPNKPAWGNVKGTATSFRAESNVQNDFPTAAEVVHGHKPKVPDSKEMEMAEAHKQARMEEADTFRGVHLDPNAHHWDEMEEDDDNFLDGVIEFGDGRQYKIENTQPPASLPIEATPLTSYHEMKPTESVADSEPVSKEDRFADDFDRSWPRTKLSTPSSSNKELNTGGAAISPSSTSPSQHSPVESSRVLFNERSNKLEPYSNNRPNQGSYQINKRGQHSEFHEARGKPFGNGEPSRGSRFGFEKPREGARRESFTSHPATSPRAVHDALPSSTSVPDFRGRRLSNMGPPPVPAHARGGPGGPGLKDRQLPPHLSQLPPSRPNERRTSESHSHPPHVPPTSSRSSSRQPSESSFLHTPATGTRTLPSESPVLGHALASSASLSPEISKLNDLSATELDDARKGVMHSAAERAKQRRQQEEEEREKERERAKHKALLLEQKMAAVTAEKTAVAGEKNETKSLNRPFIQDHNASSFINDAIASAERSKPPVDQSKAAPSRPPPRPSSHETPRVSFSRRLSSASSSHGISVNTSATPSTTAESWRGKPPSARQPPPPAFVTPPLSALDQVQSLAEDPETDLEVVDYSDLAKFVGVTEKTETPAPSEPEEASSIQSASVQSNIRSRRPVASDFFEKDATATETKADAGVWRRSAAKPEPVPSQPSSTLPSREESSAPTKEPSPRNLDQPAPSEIPGSQSTSYFATQRNPRTVTFYKEATISALDDAMSRIKGALDGMQATEKESHPSTTDHLSKRAAAPGSTTLRASPPKDKWVAPALRPRQPPQPQEDFLATSAEPPRSPKPVWNRCTVRLPQVSHPLVTVPRKQLIAFFRPQRHPPPHIWNVLSFVPPVEGMNRRDLSLNSVLFPRPYAYKTKYRYQVSLPKNRIGPAPAPKVPLQSTTPKAPLFGRTSTADGASSWRRIAKSDNTETIVELHTTSRSPPPELEDLSAVANIKPSKVEENNVIMMRARTLPKMPEGSGVAYYRDSRVVAAVPERKPSVSFFAANEPEVTKAQSSSEITLESEPLVSSIPVNLPSQSMSSFIQSSLESAKSSASTGSFGLPSLVKSSKTESKSSGDSPDRVPITPPPHHTAGPWPRSSISLSIKDSPIRGPDPEHLKAVWSQTSNKAGLHPVNSLEGIADDLTALPFIIHDVKSEDGETPPPTTTAPSRMSLHDVTRAFQQVPSSSNLNSHRPTISPPSTTAPVARPTQQLQNFGFSVPNQPANQNVHPAYPYPSPMLSHSPAPGTMYPHHPMAGSPIPSRMQVNGAPTPMYSPVWMPLPNAPTQNSTPGNMMRPMTSQYPPHPQPMAYPSPVLQHMYGMPTNMPNPPPPPPPPSQNNTHTPNRGRNPNMGMNHTHNHPSMMSPAMSHAHAHPVPMQMYAGSPGMMPTHAGRGQGRNDGHGHSNLPPHQSSHHPPPHQPFTSLPGNSFSGVRPTW